MLYSARRVAPATTVRLLLPNRQWAGNRAQRIFGRTFDGHFTSGRLHRSTPQHWGIAMTHIATKRKNEKRSNLRIGLRVVGRKCAHGEAKKHCAESVQPHVDSCVPSVGLLSASAFVLSVFLSPQWSPCASLSVSAARRSSPSNTCQRRKNEKRRDSPDRASVRRAGALGRRREASFLH